MRGALTIAAALGCVTSAALAGEVDPGAFQPYAGGLIDRLAIGTERLAAEVDAGDLEGAKEAWIAARVGWERGETFLGEYFPESAPGLAEVVAHFDQTFGLGLRAVACGGSGKQVIPMELY